MRSRSLCALGLTLLLLAGARTAAAQESSSDLVSEPATAFDGLPPVHGRDDLWLVDSLYVALDAQASLDAAAALVQADSTDWDAYVRAARAALALGIAAEERSDQKAWYLRAESYGARAVAIDSMRVDGLYWLAAARGRRTLLESPRAIVSLANEVHVIANRVLVLDPSHPGAHNILGRFNFELLILSRVERFFARHLLGGDSIIKQATWPEAERHQVASVEMAPFMILFHYELARTYARQGKRAEAREQYETVLALPIRHPPDPRWQALSKRAIERMEKGR